MIIEKMAKKKSYTWSDFYQIVKMREPKFPYRLRSDLAKLSKIPEIPNERIVFRKDIGMSHCWVIANKTSRVHRCRTAIHYWNFPHPAKCYPSPPSWTRGRGIYIDGADAAHWRDGINKLLSCPKSLLVKLNGFYLTELVYGQRGSQAERRARFSIRRRNNSGKFGSKPGFYYEISLHYRGRGVELKEKFKVSVHVDDTELLVELEKALAESQEIFDSTLPGKRQLVPHGSITNIVNIPTPEYMPDDD